MWHLRRLCSGPAESAGRGAGAPISRRFPVDSSPHFPSLSRDAKAYSTSRSDSVSDRAPPGRCVSSGGLPARPQPTAVHTFRVMTYNIHHGEGLDGKVDLLRIAELIKREGADLVALQEVDKGVERTARRDFPTSLPRSPHDVRLQQQLPLPGRRIRQCSADALSGKALDQHALQKGQRDRTRGILQLLLDVRGREIVFMATHVDHRPDDAARWSNVGEIEGS